MTEKRWSWCVQGHVRTYGVSSITLHTLAIVLRQSVVFSIGTSGCWATKIRISLSNCVFTVGAEAALCWWVIKTKTSIQFCVLKKLQIKKSWSTQTESHTEPLQLYSSVLAQPLSQLSPDWPAVWTVVGGWRPQYALSPYDVMQMNCVGSSLQLVHRPRY